MSFQPQFPSTESHHTPGSFRAFEFKTPTPISPTTDISAKGEIFPPSSISQQITISPTSTTESPITENESTVMSTTVESASTQTFHRETSRGYKESPMAHLMLQYRESGDDDISTCQQATNFSSKRTLFNNEIVELNRPQRSYALLPSLLKEVSQVVGSLQVFLERTSTLIPEQHFF